MTNNLTDGAGRAAVAIHRGLLKEGCESRVLLYRKSGSDGTATQVCEGQPVRSIGDVIRHNFRLGGYCWSKARWQFIRARWGISGFHNLQIAFTSLRQLKPHLAGADVICLYSVQMLLSPRLVREIYEYTHAPIVWTIMDIEPLTGGCHFNHGCNRFADGCGQCPQLMRRSSNDYTSRVLRWKKRSYESIPINVVAPTAWAEEQIGVSSLFARSRTRKILLSTDPSTFHPGDQRSARSQLGLPEVARVISFGCFRLADPRKGGHLLLEALRMLPEALETTEMARTVLEDTILVTFGNSEGFAGSTLPIRWVDLGPLADDESIAAVYRASDVFVCPSTDDCGPMVINEAFTCETRIVAFDSGVGPDLIKSPECGYLARKGNVADLCEGICRCLLEEKPREPSAELVGLRHTSHPRYQARQYLELFEEVLRNHGK